MRFILLLPLLLLSSPALCQFLNFTDCDQDAICLVQKSCVEKGSTEFHTLVVWHDKIEANLTSCVGIRFSQNSLRGNKKSMHVHMQIKSEKPIQAGVKAAWFAYDYQITPKFRCDKAINGEIVPFFKFFSEDHKGASTDNVITCSMKISLPNNIPMFKSRMRIMTPTEIFTYNEEDLFDLLESVAIEEAQDPLIDEYVHYCILILVIYVITVYILDVYCRRLQYTTMDREEMEEYFFPPARYIDQLNHFRMMRGPTKIEKETNIGAVPEGILIDYEE